MILLMLFLIIFTLLIKAIATVTLTIDQQFQDREPIFKLVQSQYQVIQSIQHTTFYFQTFQIDQDKYITVELIFEFPQDGYVNLDFTITQNKYDNTSSQNNVFYDMNGQYLKKQYQMIQINPFTFDKNDKFYIDINITDINFTDYQYLLKVTKTQNKICPNYCSNLEQGQCNSDLGICACSSQLIDLDCSKQAQKILFKQPLQNILIKNQEYFYFERDQLISNVSLTLGLMNPQYQFSGVEVFIMYENFIIGVPNQDFFDYYVSFSNQTSQSEEVDLTPLIFNSDIQRYERLLITVKTKTQALIYLSINISNADDSINIDTGLIVVYILVSIAITILLAWIVIIIVRYRRHSRIHDQSNIVSNQRANNDRRNKSKLDKTLIDEFMPKQLYFQILEYPELQELEIQETCSVCLLEYQKHAICRLTPCHHIFHSDCLEQWVMKHENCPLCRTTLDQKTLKEFSQQNTHLALNQYKKKQLKKQNIVIQSQLFSNAQTELRIIASQSIENH